MLSSSFHELADDPVGTVRHRFDDIQVGPMIEDQSTSTCALLRGLILRFVPRMNITYVEDP